MKKKTKTSRKNAVIKKAKAFLSRKKSKKTSAYRKTESQNLADSLYMKTTKDPAHSPGHRKMNLKENSQAEKRGPKNRMTRADRVKRTSATNRRIITGAALGKTGQIVFK
jgi:hypothetical protein